MKFPKMVTTETIHQEMINWLVSIVQWRASLFVNADSLNYLLANGA